MLSLWWMICAAANAWCADRNYRRHNFVYGTLCAVLAGVSLLLWWREFNQ